jgi:LDH2 family malate/lactate/ureidoglycolate dehydrogenase
MNAGSTFEVTSLTLEGATIMGDQVQTMNVEDLRILAERALIGLGLTAEDAEKTASILVLADLFGISTHGVSRIVSYGERLMIGGINATPNIGIEAVAPSILMVDGDNGVGPLVGRRALDRAMEAAREVGMAIAFVKGSNHFGPISPYLWLAAEAGFASMIASNATTTIAPWGGSDARLGNNPIGFGVPGPDGRHFMLDMAVSVAARAKIRSAQEKGEAIPEGWATDAKGLPTTNPGEALKGFLSPIGGHKGYGLALTVDLFAGLLSGASFLTHVRSWVDEPDKPQDLGHFFLVMDVTRLRRQEQHAERMAEFAGIIHATPPADPARPVKLPGEIELEKFHRQSAAGIVIGGKLREELEVFAARAAS